MPVSYFLVGVVIDGRCHKIGAIANGKRLQCDSATGSYFRSGTRARKELLSACKWCLNGSKVTPSYIDLELPTGGCKSIYRVFPIAS